jgi:hypothetical protein
VQTNRGKKLVLANGPVRDEFRAFIRAVLSRWRAKGEKQEPLLSWDNINIHGNVREGDWTDMGIRPSNHMLLPSYSPDMHSVIELSHALLMSPVRKYINDSRAPELEAYTKELQRLFYEVVTPRWARKTTHRLFLKVLPAILKESGGYPPKRFR